jgi:hypothetical protein
MPCTGHCQTLTTTLIDFFDKTRKDATAALGCGICGKSLVLNAHHIHNLGSAAGHCGTKAHYIFRERRTGVRHL